MGEMSKEPSMEEILSSIKRIIAEEGEDAIQPAPRRTRADSTMPTDIPAPASLGTPVVHQAIEEVLELTQEIVEDEPVAAAPKSPRTPREPAAAPAAAPQAPSILSVESEIAARQSLSALSSMLVSGKDGEDNTLDGLVRSLLRPMLKEWLDARLPAMVEEMVAREIARITAGR